MIAAGSATRILVATKPVDFRKGATGLAALVAEHLQADPFSGAIYVFRSKRADQATYRIQISVCCRSLRASSAAWPAAEGERASGARR